jgi:hypothetical protein
MKTLEGLDHYFLLDMNENVFMHSRGKEISYLSDEARKLRLYFRTPVGETMERSNIR